jgi:hypothetical protein
MNRWIAAALAAAGVALVAVSGNASAQATGTPGEPQCHGERVSFGSKEFGATPKDRAEINNISVQQFQAKVRESCEVSEQP